MANIFCHNPTIIKFILKTHLGLYMMWTQMRITRWTYVLMRTHGVFRFLYFFIVNFLHNYSEKLFIIIFFFILTIAITISRGHMRECSLICCLFVMHGLFLQTCWWRRLEQHLQEAKYICRKLNTVAKFVLVMCKEFVIVF